MQNTLKLKKSVLFILSSLVVAGAAFYTQPGAFNISYDLQALLGVPAFLAIAWSFSEARSDINYISLSKALILQIALAFLVLRVPLVRDGFGFIAAAIMSLKDATIAGTSFVFGYLGSEHTPFYTVPGAPAGSTFIFAFQALPMIMVISALSMVLFHFKILTTVVKFFRIGFEKVLDMGGAMGVFSSAKIFLGQTDAPLLIKPYLEKLTRSELFTVMTAGMATTSCMIIALYALLMQNAMTDPMIHILTATIINIPAAVLISRIMIPAGSKKTNGDAIEPYKFNSFMEAITQGAMDGLQLFLGIIAMVLVSLAFVALLDMVLGYITLPNGQHLSIGAIFGFLMAPLTWLMGVPVTEAVAAGKILGLKTALNEVIAFMQLGNTQATGLSLTSTIIMIYSICGFANLSSLGIQIGGLGGMAPGRKSEIISLAPKALLAGTLAGCLSGAIVGLLLKI